MTRYIELAPDEIYHVYNRGAHKQNIFSNRIDYARFLFLILFFQSPLAFRNISRSIAMFTKKSDFGISDDEIEEIAAKRNVELISFCLMPNHFHLIVKQIKEGGLSDYMHRIGTSFTNFYNLKYKHSGHIFQGQYKAIHIGDNDQFIYTSAYIHKNPLELTHMKSELVKYNWSSFQDYVQNNRWVKLLNTQPLLEQFSNLKEYERWVLDTSAKELDGFVQS